MSMSRVERKVDIPRDVLLAGARAALLAEGFSPENPHLDGAAEDWIDSTANVLVPAIVAAIEAWENRPHPWAALPSMYPGATECRANHDRLSA